MFLKNFVSIFSILFFLMSEFDFGETEHSKPCERLELHKSAWRCKYFP